MGIIPYALMTYGLTIVISMAVVAIIVATNKLTNREKKGGEDND